MESIAKAADSAPTLSVQAALAAMGSYVPMVFISLEDPWLGTIIQASPALEEMFGYLNGELMGKPLSILLPLGRSTKHDEHLRAFAANPENRSMGARHHDLEGVTRTGEPLPVQIELVAFFVPRVGRCAGAVVAPKRAHA